MPKTARLFMNGRSLGAVLVSNHTRHFEKVPGLAIENGT